MTQQDKDQIELPPLPEPDQYTWYSRNLVESIRRQAIAHDRRQHREPPLTRYIPEILAALSVAGRNESLVRDIEKSLVTMPPAKPVVKGIHADVDWVQGPYVTETMGRGWCVRIDGTDIFQEVNRHGCKGRITFQIADSLKTKEEAEAALAEWVRNAAPQPAAPLRSALTELVTLQDMKKRMAEIAAMPEYLDSTQLLTEHDRLSSEYSKRRPVAWSAARAALVQPTIKGSLTVDLLERVADALGRFVGDEGWGQEDMNLADEFSVALGALTTQQSLSVAEPEWIDDPHDIEQGMMRNPKYQAPAEPVKGEPSDEQMSFDDWWEREMRNANSRGPGDDWLDLNPIQKENYRACWEDAQESYQGAQPAASAEPITAEQILSLERRSNMTNDEALRFARSVESLIHRVAPTPPADGQAQQDVSMVSCDCGDMFPVNSYEAGFLDGAGHCENCDVTQSSQGANKASP